MSQAIGNKILVVSGVNIYTGGTLKVFRECLDSLSRHAGDDWQIIALVHSDSLFPEYPNVRYISYPESRKSWFIRLYYEYIGFNKLSRKLKPYGWFSILDTTPNVEAAKRIVYCQSSFPFYRPDWKVLWYQYPIFLFSIFFRYIYRINIRKNEHVIVQQEWLRKSFEEMYHLDNIVVSLPEMESKFSIGQNSAMELVKSKQDQRDKTVFFFPASPVVHKNFDVICRAAGLLEKKGLRDFEIILTIDGMENRYTRHLYKCYHHLKTVRFAGFLAAGSMEAWYLSSDCLIFPSKLETWGLPVTEARQYGLPVLLSDLPYAKETAGDYAKVKFFDPDDEEELAVHMEAVITGTIEYDHNIETIYKQPFTRNWEELFDYMLPEVKRVKKERMIKVY